MLPRTPSVYLSLLLPGLGQLFQHRWVFVGLFFFLFLGSLLLFPFGGWTVWGVAILSALDAFWFEKRHPQPVSVSKQRLLAYRVVAVVSGCLWIAWSEGQLMPGSAQWKMNQRMDKLAEILKPCFASQSVRSWAECPSFDLALTRDRWGRELQVLRTPTDFELRSAGRDGEFGTSDDLVYVYRLP